MTGGVWNESEMVWIRMNETKRRVFILKVIV